MRSLHLLYTYLSPVCKETATGKHFFFVLDRAFVDPPDQVQMQCDACGTGAFFKEKS